ncbi:MAG: alpha/beta fold hydrolase [Gemmatimonadetes bacterium]|nr:alpha/beta fold hydrolase [Gemmatimonadota bacterium]
MSVERRPFRFHVPGAEIRGDAWIPTDPIEDVAIAVCHGFKGFKDWGFFPYACERLAERVGALVVSFNFDGSGVRESDFDDLPAFGRNTFSRELWDLEAVLDGLGSGALGDVAVPRTRRFGLLGHSRGGATCVLKAGLRAQVEALVTWASIAAVDRYYDAYRERWEAGETVLIPNARTGQDMPLERNVMDDFTANQGRLDVLGAAGMLRIPCAIIHGDEDASVPFSDAEALARAIGDPARLVRVEGAGHTFQAVHPFAGTTPELERALDASVELFRGVFA